MPNHFASIGFQVENLEDMNALLESIRPQAKLRISKRGGGYLHWKGRGGEELWAQVDTDYNVVGLNPHFVGRSRLPVAIVDFTRGSEDSPFDGSISGWVDPQAHVDEAPSGDFGGSYPFRFDLPDQAILPDLQLPSKMYVQVTAFAHELKMFASVSEYKQETAGDSPQWAAQSFVPTGTFEKETPSANGFFTGVVEKTAVRKNALTGIRYHWALVHTLGGRYDVVLDRALCQRRLRKGNVLQGSFWFSARILAPEE